MGRVWPSLSGAMRSLHCSLAKSVTRVRRLYLTLRTPLSRIPRKSWLVFILDLKSYVLLWVRGGPGTPAAPLCFLLPPGLL